MLCIAHLSSFDAMHVTSQYRMCSEVKTTRVDMMEMMDADFMRAFSGEPALVFDRRCRFVHVSNLCAVLIAEVKVNGEMGTLIALIAWWYLTYYYAHGTRVHSGRLHQST